MGRRGFLYNEYQNRQRVKPNVITAVLIAVSGTLCAQPVPNPGMKELMEKVIPWSHMLPPSGNAPGKQTTIQGRTYSAYQIGLIDLFTDWIRKSYIPVGALPQPERLVLPDSKNNTTYLPRGSGVAMGLWAPCYDASGKKIIKAQPASRSNIVILTNHLKGLEAAHDFNTASQYYFTMYYDTKGRLVNPEDEQKNEPYVSEIRSKIGNHFIYFTGSTVNVLLMPGTELPVVPVSKGEVLDKAEEAIRRIYPDPGSSVRKEVTANISKYRSKYRNQLDQPAFIHQSQLGIYCFTGEYDPFEPVTNTRYMFPVYKYKPAIYELSRQDKPQWVHVSFPYATEKSSTAEWEIFKAMTGHFNYQYVYDYFFNPEKTQGQAYQPRKAVAQILAEANISERDTRANQGKNYPDGVHFMDDFSDARSGAMPAGWSSRQNNRGFEITSLPGENGKWLYLDSGAEIFPSSLKKPLPANFTLEFELICTDYKNRTGRTVTLLLSGPSFSSRLYITPGNEENIRIYPSMAGFSVSTGGKTGNHSIEFSSYSNKKTKASVRIVKSGQQISAFINGQKVESDPKYNQDYAREMGLPVNAVFNKLEWTSDVISTNPPEDKGKVYIGQIKISKN